MPTVDSTGWTCQLCGKRFAFRDENFERTFNQPLLVWGLVEGAPEPIVICNDCPIPEL